jgi:hypothetical protein
MKISLAFALTACFAFTGCYTQLYTRGYAARSVDGTDYARSPGTLADTAAPADSAALASGNDSSGHPGSVIVNNYYRNDPYYRGYRVDEWEYPFISFGFYSSRYRDYSGAYWWDDPWYGRGYSSRNYYRGGGYRRGGQGGHVPDSYPSGGGGSPGPYESDKRLYSRPPQHTPSKGRRSDEGSAATPAPAAKSSGDGGSNSGSASAPPASSDGSDSRKKEDHPRLNKGKRR